MRLSTVLPLAVAPAALARGSRMRRTNHLGGAEAGLGAEVGAVDAGHVGGGAAIDAGLGGHVGGGAAVAVPGHVGLVSGVNAVVIWVNQGGGAAAETVNEQVTVTQTVTAGAEATEVANTVIDAGATGVVEGAGATHEVTVGGDQGLSYFPQEVSAQVGDMIIFTFYAMNHTVTQSTFDDACTAMEGGMDSGFMANPDNSIDPAPQVAMQVMTEDPIWMYCAQGNHCGQGMVFSINPSEENTHAQFQSNAIAQNGDGAATGITGGEGVPPAEDSAAPPPPPEAGGETAVEGGETAVDTGAAGEETAVQTDAGAVLPSAAPEAPAPSASAPGGATLGGGIVMGQGVMAGDGSCQCAVQCGGGSFPDPGAQGVNAFGGVAGSISMGSVGGEAGASAGPSAPPAGGDASAGVTSAATVAETDANAEGGEEATDASAEGGEEASATEGDAAATEGGEDAAEGDAAASEGGEDAAEGDAAATEGGEEAAEGDAAAGGEEAAGGEAPPAPVTPPARR